MEKSYILRVLNVGLAYIIIFLFIVHTLRPYSVYYFLMWGGKINFFIFMVLIPALFLVFTSIFSKNLIVNAFMMVIGALLIFINIVVLTAQLGYIEI
ncbi:MAG: hypothetical protein ACFFFB_16250 [Candidatus Heimdallarchaeota archaeon]